ncbi:MAG: hypothetical protein ACLFTQ_00835 [Candidatus Aenigmatarchaeota archaeon]
MLFDEPYKVVEDGKSNSVQILPKESLDKEGKKDALERATELFEEGYEEVSIQSRAGELEKASWGRAMENLTKEYQEEVKENREKVENWEGAKTNAVSLPIGFGTGMITSAYLLFGKKEEGLAGAAGVGSAVLAYFGADEAAKKMVERYRSKATEYSQKLQSLRNEIEIEY